MSHRHLCRVGDHLWECDGTAFRLGRREPSVCTCHSCRLPLEQGDHSRCKNLVEIVACPEHRGEQLRRRQEAEREFEQRAAEFDFNEKWARMKALPAGREKHALAEEIVEVAFPISISSGRQSNGSKRWKPEIQMTRNCGMCAGG